MIEFLQSQSGTLVIICIVGLAMIVIPIKIWIAYQILIWVYGTWLGML